MKRLHVALFAALVAFTLIPLSAAAWIRSPATTFATLPAGATPPEDTRRSTAVPTPCRPGRTVREIIGPGVTEGGRQA